MAEFKLEINKLLKHEGGYSNNPHDPGGETKYGISKRSYPELNIASLTKSDAMSIYKKDFWDKMRLDEIKHQDVAGVVFSIGVNMGIRAAGKILQKAVNEVNNG